MQTIHRTWRLFLVCGALLACNRGVTLDPSFEGTIVMRTSYEGKPAEEMTLQVKPGKVRFDTAGQGKPLHGLYDAQNNKVTIYLDAEKAYTELNLASSSAAPNTIPEASAAEKTGKTEVIAGVKCEEWVAKEGARRSEVCLVEGVNFFDLGRLRAGAAANLGAPKGDNKMFPLRSVEYDASGKELSRMEVTRIEKGRIDEARFTPPAGYQNVTPPG